MSDPLEGTSEKTPVDFTTLLRRKMPYILGGLGIALMAIGLLSNIIISNINRTRSFQEPISNNFSASVSGELRVKKIKVDIAGAVERPNVYEIPYDSRIQDVLITAGGISPKADRIYLSKNINLAQRAVDGMKIYIPSTDDLKSNPYGAGSQSLSLVGQSTLININSASESELDGLPGVGLATASKIISGRPYGDIQDLLNRKIVSPTVWGKIKNQVSVN